MWFPGGQDAPENLGAIGAGDLIEIDAPLDNEESSGEDEIAAKIERLKKEQKKAQMRTELHCLREHKAQECVKDVLEQEFYMQKLALERAKKVRNSDVYLEKSQYALDKYVS